MKQQKFQILGYFLPEEVLPFAINPWDVAIGRRRRKRDKENRRDYEVDEKVWNVNMASDRYWVFGENLTCVGCGRTGDIMVLERDCRHTCSPHFNLYSVDSDGKWVLMTKDHIKPVSKGGRDRNDNYQTMCSICNGLKGSDERA